MTAGAGRSLAATGGMFLAFWVVACTDGEGAPFRVEKVGPPPATRTDDAGRDARAPDGDVPPDAERDARAPDVIDASVPPDASAPDALSEAAGPVTPRPLPAVPVGYDSYRLWDRMYRLRIGTRTYMRSTYDRAGGNEGADASHFLRLEAKDAAVTLDVAGPGVVTFVRTNHWHGSPWHYRVDGADHVVEESSTVDPTAPVPGSVFLPEAAFPTPLTYTWSVTQGADLDWVPIPFEETFSLAYGRTHYGTGYYIYQSFPEGSDDLSTDIRSYAEDPPPEDVLSLLGRAGEDIAPKGGDVATATGTVDLAPAESTRVVTLAGPGVVRALKLRVSKARAIALSRARLRITWDDQSLPSVEAPVALFFGAGSLYNRSAGEWLVRGLLTNIRFTDTEVELAAYFPMPFARAARVELEGGTDAVTGVAWELRSTALDEPDGTWAPFHATYRDHTPVTGQDLVFLDTQTVEGGGDYCGTFVGTSWIFSENAVLWTLEGDPRFFFDDSSSPQAYGTGTEEWGGGGDYWGGRTMTLPLVGHPVGAPDPGSVQDPEDAIESAYRILVADAMPFGKNAAIHLEHGGTNESNEHYQSVAYWYGRRGACLELTDTLHVSDTADEAAHRYSSPLASAPVELSSRYEWGVDHLGTTEVISETTDTGRSTTGTSEFTVSLAPDNVGLLLRRKLDYSLPDQRAEVLIADDRDGAPFERAGTWYLAGSSSCVYSNPWGELDDPAPVIEKSNRRWREDEFLVPRRLTEGRASVRIRIVATGAAHPLLPEDLPPATAWSEFRYSAYSWVLRP